MMDIDEIEFKDPPEFIKYVCGRLNMTKEEFRDEFHEACVNEHFDSPVFSTVRKLFRFHCFCTSRFRTKNKMLCTTKLFEYLISGTLGFDTLRRKRRFLKQSIMLMTIFSKRIRLFCKMQSCMDN